MQVITTAPSLPPQVSTPPTPEELVVAAQRPYHPPSSKFRPLGASPEYKGGRTLRPHQVQGLN